MYWHMGRFGALLPVVISGGLTCRPPAHLKEARPIVPRTIGSWESTPHLNEPLPADFSGYEGDQPLLLGLECHRNR
jgi:hypothetical protein